MNDANAGFDRDAVLADIQTHWATLQAGIDRLGIEALTGPKDHAGWTGKDHLIHLVPWGSAAFGLLQGVPRHVTMAIDADAYRSGDFDTVNETLRARYAALPLDEVRSRLQAMHDEAIRIMTETEAPALFRTYGSVDPDGMPNHRETPILWFVQRTQTTHLMTHLDYVERIVAGEISNPV